MDNIEIRIASPDDAEQLLEIYRPYVENTAISFEYGVPDVDEFCNRIINTLKKYPYLVAVLNGEIVGYTYASAFKERAAYDWAVETTIYLKNGFAKKGIGKLLYLNLEAILKRQNVTNMNACIAYAEKNDEYVNDNSMKFHEHMGYRFVGRFNMCGYKFNRWYDMIWMEKIIGEHKKNQRKFIPFENLKDK